MGSAVDGLKVAEAIIRDYRPLGTRVFMFSPGIA
jgi:hypothetical protein